MTRARKMFTEELVPDVVGEVLTFGVCRQEVPILLRREAEVAIEFATAKTQVKHAFGTQVCG